MIIWGAASDNGDWVRSIWNWIKSSDILTYAAVLFYFGTWIVACIHFSK